MNLGRAGRAIGTPDPRLKDVASQFNLKRASGHGGHLL
jgi:hypothetical protein